MFTGLGGLRVLSLLFLLVNNRKKILQLLLSDYKTLMLANDGIYSQGLQGNCESLERAKGSQGVV